LDQSTAGSKAVQGHRRHAAREECPLPAPPPLPPPPPPSRGLPSAMFAGAEGVGTKLPHTLVSSEHNSRSSWNPATCHDMDDVTLLAADSYYTPIYGYEYRTGERPNQPHGLHNDALRAYLHGCGQSYTVVPEICRNAIQTEIVLCRCFSGSISNCGGSPEAVREGTLYLLEGEHRHSSS